MNNTFEYLKNHKKSVISENLVKFKGFPFNGMTLVIRDDPDHYTITSSRRNKDDTLEMVENSR